MFTFIARHIRDRRLRAAGFIVGTLAYQRAMNRSVR